MLRRSIMTVCVFLAVAMQSGFIFAAAKNAELVKADNDCGPQALYALLHERRADVSLSDIEQRSAKDDQGTTLLGLKKAAESYGLKADGMRLRYDELKVEVKKDFGVIAFVNQSHYVWVKAVDQQGVWYQDLGPTVQFVSEDVWQQMWFEQQQGTIPSANEGKGICLVVREEARQ